MLSQLGLKLRGCKEAFLYHLLSKCAILVPVSEVDHFLKMFPCRICSRIGYVPVLDHHIYHPSLDSSTQLKNYLLYFQIRCNYWGIIQKKIILDSCFSDALTCVSLGSLFVLLYRHIDHRSSRLLDV